ncbi:tripartite ATP-independent periplasmic transporter, DctQ component [Catenovulum agarivorans DS-2]|uniref:TRAP transporter small permease protein n=1 Tax=Catenovulum agarivorans DS-2 TaxID=1328313 RepID=W7QHM4_9ALTE|nr:TRAP transporter small permease subunit [Catenovulum agarivorans]EWH11381.1 tripartite ATP-independent periplasmic transporter, DctQ component [Catenovulum agarivorans DS-2]
MLVQISDKLDAFSEACGNIVAWLATIIVLLMAGIVFLRYGLSIGSIAAQEAVLYLHSAIFLLGAAYTLKCNEHVRVDVFYSKLSTSKQALVNLCGTVLLLWPVVVTIAIYSWQYVGDSWRIMETSVDAGGLPFVYILKSFILIFCLLLLVQGLSEVIKNIKILREGRA